MAPTLLKLKARKFARSVVSSLSPTKQTKTNDAKSSHSTQHSSASSAPVPDISYPTLTSSTSLGQLPQLPPLLFTPPPSPPRLALGLVAPGLPRADSSNSLNSQSSADTLAIFGPGTPISMERLGYSKGSVMDLRTTLDTAEEGLGVGEDERWEAESASVYSVDDEAR